MPQAHSLLCHHRNLEGTGQIFIITPAFCARTLRRREPVEMLQGPKINSCQLELGHCGRKARFSSSMPYFTEETQNSFGQLCSRQDGQDVCGKNAGLRAIRGPPNLCKQRTFPYRKRFWFCILFMLYKCCRPCGKATYTAPIRSILITGSGTDIKADGRLHACLPGWSPLTASDRMGDRVNSVTLLGPCPLTCKMQTAKSDHLRGRAMCFNYLVQRT